MSGKQRRLREKRRIEIISKHQKRSRQRMVAKYGKNKFCYPTLMWAPSILLLSSMTLRWVRHTEAYLAAATNQYNVLQERIKASLEGS